MKRSLVDELIVERRIEEFRGNIDEALRLRADDPNFRRVAGRAYLVMASEWGLTPTEAAELLSTTKNDVENWIAGDYSSVDTEHLEKISCLMGIYKYLSTLYSGHFDRVGKWLRQKNECELYAKATPYDLLAGANASVFHLVRRDVAAWTV